jgi:hypothetical protein
MIGSAAASPSLRWPGQAKSPRARHGSAGWPHSGVAFFVGEATEVAKVAGPLDAAAIDSIDVTPVCIVPAAGKFVVSELATFGWSETAIVATIAQPPTTAAMRIRMVDWLNAA